MRSWFCFERLVSLASFLFLHIATTYMCTCDYALVYVFFLFFFCCCCCSEIASEWQASKQYTFALNNDNNGLHEENLNTALRLQARTATTTTTKTKSWNWNSACTYMHVCVTFSKKNKKSNHNTYSNRNSRRRRKQTNKQTNKMLKKTASSVHLMCVSLLLFVVVVVVFFFFFLLFSSSSFSSSSFKESKSKL